MRRGEVWWARIPEPVGPRPVVILTRDSVLQSIGSVVVGLVTRTVRGLPTEVQLGRREGLSSVCVLNLDNLLTVRKERLLRHLGTLGNEKVRELDAAIKFSLDLS